MATEVVHNEAQSRYEAHVDGALDGFAEYQLTDELIVFTHTEVDPAFEGQGVGSAIARGALEDVRADGLLGLVDLVRTESVEAAIRDRVAGDFVELNIRALHLGFALGRPHRR